MSGALLLGMISLVAVADVLIALRFRAMADDADPDLGARPNPKADPRALRRAAGLLLLTAPLLWLVIAALSFGLVPVDGIVPVKF